MAQLIVPPGQTLFHITHWKAGSQWMRAMLEDAFKFSIPPQQYETQVLSGPIQTGCVYTCVYLGKPEFESLQLPASRRVVIIRDLRDSLVSGYFSLLLTHVASNPWILKFRTILQRLSEEEGLEYLMETWLPQLAQIQRTWVEAGEPCIKLENCMANPEREFRNIFFHFGIEEIDPALVAILASKFSFKKLSGGRRPGEEDQSSHYRKGVSGDWREHFTSKISKRFKLLYGDLLITSGYEQDHSW